MRWARRSHDEDGITLVELLITVVLMSMIMGAIAASFVTAFNTTRPNSERVRQSNDAQLIAGFLVRDAQSAGGTDPSTGTAYDTTAPDSIGVSTSDAAGCSRTTRRSYSDSAGSTTFLMRPRSPGSRTTTSTRRTRSCARPASTAPLNRRSRSAARSRRPTQRAIRAGTRVRTCPTPSRCTSSPQFRPAVPARFTYDLTASLRPEGQDKPTDSNAAPIGLLALGHACTQGTTGFAVSGGSPDANPNVTIYGQVVIDTKDGIVGCKAMRLRDSYTYNSGAISIFKGGTCSGCPNDHVVLETIRRSLRDCVCVTQGRMRDGREPGGQLVRGGKHTARVQQHLQRRRCVVRRGHVRLLQRPRGRAHHDPARRQVLHRQGWLRAGRRRRRRGSRVRTDLRGRHLG